MKKITIALCLVIIFASCKKDRDAAPALTVTAADLSNYYIALERLEEDGKTRYRAIYFENKDGVVNATHDGAGTRRGQAVSVENNTFRFDLGEDNGKTTVLLLTFEKKNDGAVVLKSLSNVGTSVKQIVHAEMYALSAVPDWSEKKYIMKSGSTIEGSAYVLQANLSTVRYFSSATANIYLSTYAVGSGVGFKNDVIPMMGIIVAGWKGQGKIKLLMEREGKTGTYGDE